MTLSAKQLEVRDFILAYQAEHGEPPALKDIMNGCGLSNVMMAKRYRDRLKKAGALEFIGYAKGKAAVAGKEAPAAEVQVFHKL